MIFLSGEMIITLKEKKKENKRTVVIKRSSSILCEFRSVKKRLSFLLAPETIDRKDKYTIRHSSAAYPS